MTPLSKPLPTGEEWIAHPNDLAEKSPLVTVRCEWFENNIDDRSWGGAGVRGCGVRGCRVRGGRARVCRARVCRIHEGKIFLIDGARPLRLQDAETDGFSSGHIVVIDDSALRFKSMFCRNYSS
jgi:hypothetical protein